MSTYIKNKHKRDKRISNRKEEKQVRTLYNNIFRESQLLTNVVNLGKVFLENNKDLVIDNNHFINIVSQISNEINPIPLSKATLEHGAKLLKEHYNNLKKA